VARRGLSARYGREPVLELARQLAEISRGGLARLAQAGRRDPDETGFLDPIFAQLGLGASPGRLVVDRWEGEWARSVDRLIEYARY
jgi:gamma-glutamylcysteine synthetase